MLLIFAGVFLSHWVVAEQVGSDFNFARFLLKIEQQQILGHQICKNALIIRQTQNPSELRDAAQDLRNSIDSWERLQTALIDGDSRLDIPSPQDPRVKESLEATLELNHDLAESARKLSDLAATGEMDPPRRAQCVTLTEDLIGRKMQTYQTRMGQIGLRIEEDARQRMHDASTRDFVMSYLILGFVLIVFLLLFVPLSRTIEKQFNRMARSEAKARRLALFASRTHNSVVFLDALGKIEWVNDGFTRMTGYALDEVKGRDPGSVLEGPDTDAQVSESARKKLETGEEFKIEIVNYTKQKRKYWASVEIQPIRDDSGRILNFIGLADDITERKFAEEKFRVLFEFSSDAHLIFNETGIIECNNATIQMLRCKEKAQVLHLHPATLSPEFQPDGRRSMEKCIEMDETARRNGFHRFDWLHQKSDGEVFPVEVTLTPIELAGKPAMLTVWHDLTDRKRAEEELRRSEERFSLIVKGTMDGIWDWNLLTDEVYWSDRLVELIGYSPDQLRAQRGFIRARMHPDDIERMESDLKRHLAERVPFNPQYRIMHKDGSYRWYQGAGQAQWDKTGKPIRMAGSISDITDRKLAEIELKLSQARLAEAQRMARIGSWHYDVPTQLIWWSQETLRIFGFPTDGKAPTFEDHKKLIHPEDLALWLGTIERAAVTGEDYQFEYRNLLPDGSSRFLLGMGRCLKDPRGKIIEMSGTVQDITDRKLSEKALRVSEERLKLALESTQDGLFDWDIRSNQIFFSPRWMEMLGYGPNELPQDVAAWTDRVNPDDGLIATKKMFDMISGKIPTYETEFRMRHKDGHWIWVLSRAKVVDRSPDGKVLRVVGATSDITQRKLAEVELRNAMEAADAANRTKSEFLANMSHEIRTPMTAILGFTDLLQKPDLDAARRVDFIQTIRRNGEHLLSIINDILDLSKIEAGRVTLEKIDCRPARIVNEVASLLTPRALEKGLNLDIEYSTPIPETITSDPVRIRQVLMNLVGNAIKFTREGGVKLSVAFEPGSPPASGALIFSVIDTGIGLTQEQQSRIFLPFNQADSSTTRKFGGSGLGLSISRSLATLLGGSITVTSSPGIGSIFVFTIDARPAEGSAMIQPANQYPETEPNSPYSAHGNASTTGTELTGARILLAEDGIDNQRYINYVLTDAGAIVDIVENGRLAVEMAVAAMARKEPYDVILMDMQMPELDGYGATALLRARGYRAPIVALTAHAMAGERERCLNVGCNDHETKPIDVRHLYSTICRLRNA